MGVGARIRQIRKTRRITQEELAEKLNMTRANVSKLETGEGRIDADLLPKIAGLLGVSPCDFFEEGKPPKAEPAVERAAERAAEIAVERVRGELREELHRELREELRAALAEVLPREREAPGEPRVAEEGEPYRPSLAEIYAREKVRWWEGLPESKQRRIWEILEEPEESGQRPGSSEMS